ncbi:Glycerophosphoryl diester phosphodiesterase family-domain-containing protein [Dunaliella salina]|uniref:glycerophosphodiester phosphodiesterase n=1 Tax=Dunaliella salina TaxID=3046 RepID=A0ABQ7FU56_DUNSA|nr:Glycerophosphoryl diester phosphodiesterase family-domain-containing protein [Dunaliella salina]|eukprot:KAF5825964.1 Glycerophosphoryl diester phosphodiesterase family-domain-containing protein [Dunaliella salina]
MATSVSRKLPQANINAVGPLYAQQQQHQQQEQQRGLFNATGASTLSVWGHRGSGSNLATHTPGVIHPVYRENTLRSLSSAATSGASFVEFDVQVTLDGVAVLWHDDEVIAADSLGHPVHSKVADLTLTQFKALVPKKEGSSKSDGKDLPQATTPLLRQFEDTSGHQTTELSPWVVEADDELPTLSAIFEGLPEDVGLNVEIKMAVPDTVAVTPAEEVQRMLTPILQCVDRHVGPSSTRAVTFSSFDPDVCIALRRELAQRAQQHRFPIMFLSGCGLYPHVDVRRTSIEATISTALDAGLTGIVVPASVLLSNQDMVAAARAVNLAVATYGQENNVPENVQQQAALGVQAAIVDEVELVSKYLKASQANISGCTGPGIANASTPAAAPPQASVSPLGA